MTQVLRRLRTRILWIAALAVLFGSVVPSLTTFLASSSGQAWIEVCTSTGTKLVAVDVDETPSPCPVFVLSGNDTRMTNNH